MTTIFQRTDHLTSSSKPAGSSEIYEVTEEGARGDLAAFQSGRFCFSRAKKRPF